MNPIQEVRHTYIRREGDVVVLKPRGDLTGGEETDELDRLASEFDEEQSPALVINLADVHVINSLAISRLVRAHLRFTRRGGRMAICCLDARVQHIFEVTRLGLVMTLRAGEDAAVTYCRQQRS